MVSLFKYEMHNSFQIKISNRKISFKFLLIAITLTFTYLLNEINSFFTENCINYTCKATTAQRNGFCIENSGGNVIISKCPKGTFCNSITLADSGSSATSSLQKCIGFTDFFSARLESQRLANKQTAFIPVNYYCENNSDCISNNCSNNYCLGIPTGESCPDKNNLIPSCELTSYCNSSGICVAKAKFTNTCTKDYECPNTGGCFNGICTEYYSLPNNYNFDRITLDQCNGNDCGPDYTCIDKKCVKSLAIGASCTSGNCPVYGKCNNKFICEKVYEPGLTIFPNVYCESNFATYEPNLGSFICTDVKVKNTSSTTSRVTCAISDSNSCQYNYNKNGFNLQYFFTCGCDLKTKTSVCQEGTNDDSVSYATLKSRNSIIKQILSLCPRNYPLCQNIINTDLYQKDVFKYINSGVTPVFSDSTSDLGIQLIIGNLIVYEICEYKPEQITSGSTSTTINNTPTNADSGENTKPVTTNSNDATTALSIIDLEKLDKIKTFSDKEFTKISSLINDLLKKYDVSSLSLAEISKEKVNELEKISDSINDLIESYASSLKNNTAQPNKNIFDIVSTGVGLGQILINTNLSYANDTTTTGTSNKEEELLSKTKKQIDTITSGFLNYSINTNQKVDVYKETPYFTVQIIDSNLNKTPATETSKGDLLSIVDINECEAKIKGDQSNKNFVASQIDFSSNILKKNSNNKNFDNLIAQVKYDLYDSTSGKKVDIKQGCKEEEIVFKIPLKNNNDVTKQIDFTKYQEYIKDGINIYNKQSDFYNSRCFSYSVKNNTNKSIENYDMTINKRRSEVYQNFSISCGEKCEFAEIDSKNYMVCKCLNTADTKVLFEKLAFDFISTTNIDIFTCAASINQESLSKNIGFFFYVALIVSFIVSYVFFRQLIYRNSFNVNLNKIELYEGVKLKYEDVIMKEKNQYKKISEKELKLKYDLKQVVKIQSCIRMLLSMKRYKKNKRSVEQVKENNTNSKKLTMINNNDHNNENKISEGNLDNKVLLVKSDSNNKNLNNNEFSHVKNASSDSKNKIQNNKQKEYSILNNEIDADEKTLNDFEELKINELDILDNRSTKRFLWHMLITRHNFFLTFFRFSVFNPIIVRLTKYLIFLSINFSLNAVFFNDQYIEEKAQNQQNENLIYVKNDFLYSLIKLIWKSILSAVICWIPVIILNLLTNIPRDLKIEIFKSINLHDNSSLKVIYLKFKKSMKISYILFGVFASSLIILSWYYSTVFCSIYKYSSIVWFYGGVISILLDFVIQFTKITFIMLIRALFISFPKSK